MVSIKVVKYCNAALIKSQQLVAVITGGTSGIGEHTIRTLADIHGKEGRGLRIYLVGRKEGPAKKIISDCLELCPLGDFRFVQAGDLALLKDVDYVCAEITKAEEAATSPGEKPRIDFLVMGQAYLAFEARQGEL
jgi:NAD(P)-dependent dehydrogenase (short-subunit alcohol dehydrogenase family)